MKVYIWYPTLMLIQVGHAALTLDDGTHISWWPTGKTEGKKSKKNPREVGSLDEDIELEGRKPDKVLEVTSLDETRIKQWWEKLLVDPGEKYNIETRNCCHIVMDALKAGGFKCKSYDGKLLMPQDVESILNDDAAACAIF